MQRNTWLLFARRHHVFDLDGVAQTVNVAADAFQSILSDAGKDASENITDDARMQIRAVIADYTFVLNTGAQPR